MKVGPVILFATLVASAAQNAAPTVQPPKQEIQVEAPRPPRTSEVNTNALSNPKPGQTNLPTIFYSGLGPDIRKSTNRWRMFSLRKKVDLKTDGENLIMDTRTEAARPFKLFSIDF